MPGNGGDRGTFVSPAAPSTAGSKAPYASADASPAQGRDFTCRYNHPCSMTPSNPPATSPMGAPAPAYAGGGSFFQRHPFMTGLAGGFLGSMLFSHLGGLGTGLGFLLTLLIIGGLIFFVVRLLAGRRFATAGGGAM